MALIDVLKRTKAYSAEKTKKVYDNVKDELGKRVGTRALYDYATQNSRFGKRIGDALGIGQKDTNKPIKAKDTTTPQEKQEQNQPETQNNPQANIESTQAKNSQAQKETESAMGNEKVYHKLVDIESALNRLDDHQASIQQHTQHVMRDSISELIEREETKIENNKSSEVSNSEIKSSAKETKIENNKSSEVSNSEIKSSAKETNNALIERLEDESDDSVAVEQAKDIHKIRESVERIIKGGLSKDNATNVNMPFKERLGHLILDHLEQKDGIDIDRKRNKTRPTKPSDTPKRTSKIREAFNNKADKFKSGTKSLASKVSPVKDKATSIGKNIATRTGGLLQGVKATAQGATGTIGQAITSRLPTTASIGTRTAPLISGATSALSGATSQAGGALATMGGGTLAAIGSALLFGGTGLYSAYKAMKGEDASNWISNLADKGYQSVSGNKDGTLGTALYDALHDDTTTQSDQLKPIKAETEKPKQETTQSENQIVTVPKETVKENLKESETKETNTIKLEKAPFATDNRVNNVSNISNATTQFNNENLSKPETKIENSNYELKSVSQLPTITDIAKADTKKEQVIEKAQSNPKPVVIQPPTQTPQSQIQGGGRSNQEQPPIITKPIDSTLRMVAQQFIFNGV